MNSKERNEQQKKFFDFPSLRKKRNVLTISKAKACDGLPIHLFVNLTKTSKLIFRAFSKDHSYIIRCVIFLRISLNTFARFLGRQLARRRRRRQRNDLGGICRRLISIWNSLPPNFSVCLRIYHIHLFVISHIYCWYLSIHTVIYIPIYKWFF